MALAAVWVLYSTFLSTYGTGIANVLTALRHGICTIDLSVSGLGGCPYSPGATGNVVTEDVLYALQGSPYHIVGSSSGNTINLRGICEIGNWISRKLGRTTVSRVGKAMLVRRQSSKWPDFASNSGFYTKSYVFDPRPSYPLVFTAVKHHWKQDSPYLNDPVR